METTLRNILLIRPSALGDVARSVTILASVRRAYPGAAISWVVEQGCEEIVAHHPMLTSVVSFPKGAIKTGVRRLDFTALAAFFRELRRGGYDAVLDLQGLARSALMAYATGAPLRVGLADARELGWAAYTQRIAVDANLHTVDRMLGIGAGVGIAPVHDMRLYTPPVASAWRSEQRWDDGRYVVVAPTSRWPAKQWPIERFERVVAWLRADGRQVLVVGGRSERDQCGPLLELAKGDAGIVDLVGGTSIGQLMACIEGARLVVGNDSAALHIAVGYDRPLVGLYGPTRVAAVGPYLRAGDVIQHVNAGDVMNHKEAGGVELMRRITADEVIAGVAARLSAE